MKTECSDLTFRRNGDLNEQQPSIFSQAGRLKKSCLQSASLSFSIFFGGATQTFYISTINK